jgi:hypothetical protein
MPNRLNVAQKGVSKKQLFLRVILYSYFNTKNILTRERRLVLLLLLP